MVSNKTIMWWDNHIMLNAFIYWECHSSRRPASVHCITSCMCLRWIYRTLEKQTKQKPKQKPTYNNKTIGFCPMKDCYWKVLLRFKVSISYFVFVHNENDFSRWLLHNCQSSISIKMLSNNWIQLINFLVLYVLKSKSMHGFQKTKLNLPHQNLLHQKDFQNCSLHSCPLIWCKLGNEWSTPNFSIQ